MNSTTTTVEKRAYELWQSRGCPTETAESDWYEAEQLIARESQASAAAPDDIVDQTEVASFPASDPPASHLPDRPPSNAGDQWAAAKSRRGRK
jgi:Protein of unknown function (DUF2934)